MLSTGAARASGVQARAPGGDRSVAEAHGGGSAYLSNVRSRSHIPARTSSVRLQACGVSMHAAASQTGRPRRTKQYLPTKSMAASRTEVAPSRKRCFTAACCARMCSQRQAHKLRVPRTARER